MDDSNQRVKKSLFVIRSFDGAEPMAIKGNLTDALSDVPADERLDLVVDLNGLVARAELPCGQHTWATEQLWTCARSAVASGGSGTAMRQPGSSIRTYRTDSRRADFAAPIRASPAISAVPRQPPGCLSDC